MTGQTPKQAQALTALYIIVVDPYFNEEVLFKIKRDAKMRRLFVAYCKRKNYDSQNLLFFYQGERINDDDTPDSLVLQDGAKIITAFR